MHSTYSINGNHQQRSGGRTATDCSRETSADSNRGRGTPHQQNQVLEEPLCRKVGHGIQEEDQEGTSVKRRDRERPKGSNSPSKPKRQNVSIPSLTDMTPPPVVAEIQVKKEQMEVMMNTFKGRVSSDLDDLVNGTDSTFTASVNSFPLPHKFCMP